MPMKIQNFISGWNCWNEWHFASNLSRWFYHSWHLHHYINLGEENMLASSRFVARIKQYLDLSFLLDSFVWLSQIWLHLHGWFPMFSLRVLLMNHGPLNFGPFWWLHFCWRSSPLKREERENKDRIFSIFQVDFLFGSSRNSSTKVPKQQLFFQSPHGCLPILLYQPLPFFSPK